MVFKEVLAKYFFIKHGHKMFTLTMAFTFTLSWMQEILQRLQKHIIFTFVTVRTRTVMMPARAFVTNVFGWFITMPHPKPGLVAILPCS